MQRLITLCLVIVLAFGAVQPAAAQSVHPSRVDPAPLRDKPDRIPPSTPAAPATESHGVSDGAWTAISDPSFAWTACTDEGGSGLAGYNVYWGTDPAATSGVLQVETSYLPAAFTPPGAATYYLRVQSKDGAGNTSPWVTLFTYRYDSVAPLASGVITEGHGVQSDVIQGTVYAPSFAWEPGTETDSSIQSYQVYWGSDPNASQPLETPVLAAEERGFTPESVLISGSYYLRVFARDAAGNLSPASDPFVFRYQGTAPAPQVTGIAIDPGAVNLVADPAARLNYGPQSGGAFQLTVSTGQVGPFDVGLKQIVFPNLFSTSDGTVIDLSGEMNPASYSHTYTVPSGATVSGSFDVQVVSLTDQVTSAGFEVVYDATPPVVEGFQLDLAGLQNGYVSGTTLYYGPASTGNLAMSLQASDASGVGEMSFPALFQLEAQTLPGGEPEAVYSRSYAVDGMIDTTAGTFEVLVIDRVGNQSHTTFTLVKDSTAPTLTLNAPGTAGLLFEVAWSGQDAEAGLGSFDVQVWDGTTWSDWLSDTTDTQAELVGEEGPNRVRVVGRDRVGNLVASPEGVVSVSGRTKYYQMSGQVVAMRQGNELSYLSGDHLGSTSLVTNASGQAVAQARYYPFGEERWSSGGLPTDKTFTGQRSETFGLMDYNARYYDPTLGRFISPDSLVPESVQGVQAWDRYAYANNNPTRYNDPTGHCSISASTFMSPLGIFGFYASCVQDVVDAYNAYQGGETDLGMLYMEATGAKDAVVSMANDVHQLNKDVSTVFSNAPLEERIGPAIHVGTFAVGTAATIVGVPTGQAASSASKIPATQSRGGILANKKVGDAFRDEIADMFTKAGYGVEKEIVKKTPFGTRRIDIEVTSPQGTLLGGVETKVGTSRYLASQRAKDAWLRIQGYIVSVVRK